ncbi:DUF5985 family protein [Ramlibacter sp. PS4R-6]|uniref:DUF5985 family protein n=1 Tax=Ramlibacter sp. PS4R-6 TaxID=3133438 RepID=UPI0030A38D51
MTPVAVFLTGGICVACFVIALFFLRFWRATRDRFFVFFALSFALEGGARGASAFLQLDDNNPAFYAVRVVAYGLIIAAIWQKNRR